MYRFLILLPLLMAPLAQAGAADPVPAAPAPAPAPVPTAAPAPAAAPAVATTYNLDVAKSWLYVVVRNDRSTMASGLGHDHGVRATTFTSNVVWNAGNVSECKISFDVPTSGLRADPEGMRARVGLDPKGAVKDADLATIQTNFSGSSQLDVAKFPTITYTSTSCSPRSDGKVDVLGTLNIRGVGMKFTVPMTVKADGNSFSAKGTFILKHEDFGFDPFSALMGALRNRETLEFGVDVVGTKK